MTSDSCSHGSRADGSWGDWSSWSTCPVTCGIGDQIRTRLCNSPMPTHGGHDCTANGSRAVQNQTCNTDPCQGKQFKGLNVWNKF